MELHQNSSVAFEEIYARKKWGDPAAGHPISGSGSQLHYTLNLRKKLPIIISKFNVKTIFDCPCGDFNWMREVDLQSVNYTGGDIVQKIVDLNNELYSCSKVNFIKFDIVENHPPAVDLMIVRDCFIHFPRWATKKALSNIRKSKVKYILTTTTSSSEKSVNNNINFGDWTWLNLRKSPYHLPAPILKIKEEENKKFICLWRTDQIPELCDV
jgi:hypothetical protein